MVGDMSIDAKLSGASGATPRRVGLPGEIVLEIADLVVEFRTRNGTVRALNGVDLQLRRGETLGLVGESGSGKSMTALSVLGLLPRNARIVRGSIRVHGSEIVAASSDALRALRGRVVSIVLQDPMTSLNPAFTIGWQVGEAVDHVASGTRATVRKRVIELLAQMGIPAPEERSRAFPHQMSGGMRQRSVSAIAFAGPPEILLADEPTTSLDATIQAQYLRLLKTAQAELGVAVLFITHDFGIVAEVCDRVAVMYAGRIVETADVVRLFDRPSHPYTRALLDSVPRLGQSERLHSIPGQPPAAGQAAVGCPFAPRCPLADERCSREAPPRVALAEGHWADCWHVEGAT
jgi:oligopeptide/dipeptide ABC transporter ATP-binding protein